MPAYFNNTVYYGSVGSPIQAFTIINAKLSTSATAQTSNSFGYPATTPSVSANGSSNGIVWAVENTSPSVLHAYNASTLNEFYNSNQASSGRDQFGPGNVHHPNDRERQGLRGNAEWRGGVRAVALMDMQDCPLSPYF
jgi:hypothetical protein